MKEYQLKSFHSLIEAVCTSTFLALPQLNLPYFIKQDTSNYKVVWENFKPIQTGNVNKSATGPAHFTKPRKGTQPPKENSSPLSGLLISFSPTFHARSSLYLPTIPHLAGCWQLLTIRSNSALVPPSCGVRLQIQYKTGKSNTHDYALSRLRTSVETTENDEEELPTLAILGKDTH